MKNGAEGDSPRPLMDMHAPRPEGSSLTARPMRTHSVRREKGSRTSSPARDAALEEADIVCADTMLMRVRLGLTPTEDAERLGLTDKEELRKYQQLQQRLNEEHNAEALKESTTPRRGTEDNRMDTTSGYTKMSFSTMCAMLQYRGHGLSEAQLKEQWRYLKQVEDDEAHEKPMLCAQGCGLPVTRRKKGLSPEAQYELLRKSCCSACWMHAHFPQEYVRLGWDQREADHGGGCLQDLLKSNLCPEKDVDALETIEWQHLET